MTSSHDDLERRALDLVERALAVDEDRRATFVAEAAGGDESLRRRALAILGKSSNYPFSLRTGGGLERVTDEALPEEIAGYRIEAEIGRGGMGAVYLGRRPGADFDHPVAIKVVRSAASARLLERLRFERRTLARLKHPNIAQMYDGGETPEGEPYFVMEYAPGVPVHRYLEEKAPGLEARLNIFLDVCAAVAYAHKNLVIHRDLSPSNILVTEEGRAKLIDFGIAHSLEDEAGDDDGPKLTMTKGYAAPERADGAPASTITDVYSLGVILQDLVEVLSVPRRADLAAIVRKASAPAPDDRYPTVDALTADLAAWRAGSAVAAVEKGWTYAFARFVVRRKLAVGAGAVAATVVFASSIIMSVLYIQAETARKEAQGQTVRAERQTARAEAAAEFLQDIMASADPRAPGAGYSTTLRDALARATDLIGTRFAGDPDMEVMIRETAAEVATGIQDFDAAITHYRRMGELLESVYGPASPETLKARYSLGETLMRASRFEEAGDVLDAADADAGRLLESDHKLAFAASRTRGRLHMGQVQMAPAAAQFEKAMIHLAAFAPDDARALHALSLNLAQSYVRIGRQEEAVTTLAMLQGDERFAAIGEAARAAAKLQYGAALLHSGRHDEAEPVLKDAVAGLADVYGPQSNEVAQARSNLGNLYAATGRWAEALPLIASVRERLCAAHGDNHIGCFMSGGNEGVILAMLGRNEEAAPKLAAARDAAERAMGPATPGVQLMEYYLAQALIGMGDGEQAAALVDGLDPAQLALGSPGEAWPSRVMALKGWTMLVNGAREEGAVLLETAVAEMEREGLEASIIAPFHNALSGDVQ